MEIRKTASNEIRGRKSEMFSIILDEKTIQDKYHRHKYLTDRDETYYKGFVPHVSDVLREFDVSFQPFENSVLVSIEDEEYAIFQRKSNSGRIIFQFSDLFKAYSINSFKSKIRKFLKEKINEEVAEAISETIDYVKEELEPVKDEFDNYNIQIKSYEKNQVLIKIFDFMKIDFYINGSKIIVSYNNRYNYLYDKVLNISKKAVENFVLFLTKYKNRYTLTIRGTLPAVFGKVS